MSKSKFKSSRRSEAIRTTIPQRSFRISHPLIASPVRLSLSRSFHRSNARSHALAKRLIRSVVPITPVKAHAIQRSFINYANNSHLIKNAICAKRKIRREVLFATGKGGGNHRPPSYSLESQIRCS